MLNPSKQWWRWIALPFASVAGGALAYLGALLLAMLIMKYTTGDRTNTWFFKYVVQTMAVGACAYAMALTAACLAPRGKTAAAFFMSIPAASLLLLGSISSLTHVPTAANAVRHLVWSLALLLGALAAIVQVRRAEQEITKNRDRGLLADEAASCPSRWGDIDHDGD